MSINDSLVVALPHLPLHILILPGLLGFGEYDDILVAIEQCICYQSVCSGHLYRYGGHMSEEEIRIAYTCLNRCKNTVACGGVDDAILEDINRKALAKTINIVTICLSNPVKTP